MEKAKKIFLYIGIAVFIVTFIYFAIDAVMSARASLEYAREVDIFGGDAQWFWIGINILAVPVPILLSEIIMIKNGCILLSKDESKSKKVLSIISSVLLILVAVMIIIAVNDFVEYKIACTILLSLWLPIIASFILTYKIKV